MPIQRPGPSDAFIVKVFSFILIGCMAAMAIIALAGITGGLKFLDTSPATNENQGQCCEECVESAGKFFGFVIGIPAAILLLGVGLLIAYAGFERVKGVSASQMGSIREKVSASSFEKKINASRILVGAGLFVFALSAVIMTFKSGRFLYSSTDSDLNSDSSTTLTKSSCEASGKTWCIACKPEFWRLFLMSAFFGLLVWGAAFGVYIKGVKDAKRDSKTIASF